MKKLDVIYKNKRISILSPFVIRIENKYQNKFFDHDSLLIPNRNIFNGVEKINKVKDTYFLYDSRYTFSYLKIELKNDIKIYQKEKLIYSYNQAKHPLVNSGELPIPNKCPTYFEIIDSPRIYQNKFYENTKDIYVLFCFNNPKLLLKLYRDLTGPTNLVPFSCLGLWDSKYHRYTDTSVINEINLYRKHDIPIDNFVIDTDWRINTSTGYNINTKLFPNFKDLIKRIHSANINLCLNDHPQPFKAGKHLFNQQEINYRKKNLTKLFSLGLDYWWYDRNWTVKLISPSKNINAETLATYQYQLINEEYNKAHKINKRILTLTNVDDIHNGTFNKISSSLYHRFPITWTGDIRSNENVLKNEIKNMIMCGYNSIPYVSSDLGGHIDEPNENLLIRWYQFGALSPILRIHPTCYTYHHTQVFDHSDKLLKIARNFVKLRYSFLPMLYRLAFENYKNGTPVCSYLPLYFNEARANRFDEYMIGDNILVAPITDDKNVSEKEIYLPNKKTTWINFFNHKIYQGGQTIKEKYSLSEMPIFIKSSSILVRYKPAISTAKINFNNVYLDVFVGDENYETYLYEDDRISNNYQKGKYHITNIKMTNHKKFIEINIDNSNNHFLINLINPKHKKVIIHAKKYSLIKDTNFLVTEINKHKPLENYAKKYQTSNTKPLKASYDKAKVKPYGPIGFPHSGGYLVKAFKDKDGIYVLTRAMHKHEYCEFSLTNDYQRHIYLKVNNHDFHLYSNGNKAITTKLKNVQFYSRGDEVDFFIPYKSLSMKAKDLTKVSYKLYQDGRFSYQWQDLITLANVTDCNKKASDQVDPKSYIKL